MYETKSFIFNKYKIRNVKKFESSSHRVRKLKS